MAKRVNSNKSSRPRKPKRKGPSPPNAMVSRDCEETMSAVAWYIALGYSKKEIAVVMDVCTRTITRYSQTEQCIREIKEFQDELKNRILDCSVQSLKLAELTLQSIMLSKEASIRDKLDAAKISLACRNKPSNSLIAPEEDATLNILRSLREDLPEKFDES